MLYTLEQCAAIIDRVRRNPLRYAAKEFVTVHGHAEGSAKHVGGQAIPVQKLREELEKRHGRHDRSGKEEIPEKKSSSDVDKADSLSTIGDRGKETPEAPKEKTMELPALKGSEKQVVYAEKVRRTTLDNFDYEILQQEKFLQDTSTEMGIRRGKATLKLLQDAKEAIAASPSAAFHLDIKTANPKQIALALFGDPDGNRIGREFGARDAAKKAGVKIEPRMTRWQHTIMNVNGYFDPEEKEDPKKVTP